MWRLFPWGRGGGRAIPPFFLSSPRAGLQGRHVPINVWAPFALSPAKHQSGHSSILPSRDRVKQIHLDRNVRGESVHLVLEKGLSV